MKLIRALGALALTAMLVACGGGGGSPGGTSSAGTGGTGGGGTTGSPTLVVSIVNQAGASVNSISVGGAFRARATLRNATGAAIPNTLVSFSLNGASIATIAPSTALTDGSGNAEVVIAPASLSSVGAARLSADAEVSGVAAAGQVDFSVSAASLSLSSVSAGTTTLPSAGNTSLSTTALVGGVPSTGVPVNVTFSASCGRINSQEASGSVTTNGDGVASAVYSAVASDGTLCSGAVTVSASSPGSAPRSITLNVAPPNASAVTFVSAAPAQIFVAGSGAVEQAIVRFRVLSTTGAAMANESVRFTLTANPGGVGIGSVGSTAPVDATTDAQGVASVSVFSGTIPGPLTLRASLASNAAIFAESQNLTVASGPPSQRFMSLAVETFNIEGANRDGTSTRLTARIADRQGNAVVDGTVVNFTAEGGQVTPSCATTRNNGISSCFVTFVSQNPRPANGRVSVMAHTEGTKDYVDVNANNIFDGGDSLVQIGDAYRDDNEDNLFTVGEFRVPRGVSGATCPNAGAPFPSIASSCDTTLATTVRQQTVIMFSSSSAVLTDVVIGRGVASVQINGVTQTISVPTSVEVEIGSADYPLLPMPAGTTVAMTAVDSNTTDGAACAISFGPTGTPIPNISPGTSPGANLATRHNVSLRNCRSGDDVRITVTAPSGLATQFAVGL